MSIYNYLIDPIGETQRRQNILTQQLSSGVRIVSPWIDAAGLAVANKLDAAISHSSIVVNNLATTNSYLQTQSGVMDTANEVLDRMGQLKAMSEGIFGDATGAYQTEYAELQDQLSDLGSESFNGVPLFSDPEGTLAVMGNESGSISFNVSQANLAEAVSDVTLAANLSDLSMDDITDATQNVSNLQAVSGAGQSRIEASFDLMRANYNNYSSAYSTIMDVDWARATTDFALANIRSKAGYSFFSQALTTGTTVGSLLS